MSVKTIVGPNASGKSRLVKEIVREFCAREGGKSVADISFRDSYGVSDEGYYLQQRWNTTQYDDVLTVRESFALKGLSMETDAIPECFDIDALMDKPMIQLSSGELRKYQIVKALLHRPKLLVIDNPYIGLDEGARRQMDSLLRTLAAMPGISLLLMVAREADVPEYTDDLVRLEAPACYREPIESVCARVSSLGSAEPDYRTAVALNNVSIKFGDRCILKDLDWQVDAGTHWAIEGPNGSGKSTLLSIICADIPQAYACDVTLFDHRRGTGESIWDIKRHIGFVSPELHRAYKRNVPAIDVVASGLHDMKGLYTQTSAGQIPQCEFWMDVFGISSLRDRSFLTLSSGEQRLVLLARAFVKDPDLLILDEPFHGLDDENSVRAKAVIEAFSTRPGKTLLMVSHFQTEFPSCIDHHLRILRE